MYELKKMEGRENRIEGRENRSDKTDIKKQNTMCKIREKTICNTICKIRENTICNIREIIYDTMKQENIGKIRDMIGNTMKQHTMNISDTTKEEKTDGKIGNNKRDSMQHILQTKTKEENEKNRREKINKKEKRENMQHILQLPKRIKIEESDPLLRISQPETGG